MTLSAELQAAFDAGQPPLWLFEAELPDGTRRIGRSSVGSSGHYEGILSSGDLEEQFSDEKSGAIFNASFSLTIDDRDKSFWSLTESALADQIKGTTGVLYLAAAGVARANWSERFRGKLAAYSGHPGRDATLVYRQESLPLLRPGPDPGWRIGLSFPHALAALKNEIAPLLYGKFNSAPYTNQGFVPGLLVDPTGNKRHLVCAARAKAVSVVWKNGLQQIVTIHYTIQYREISGRLFTLIEWTAAGKPADDDEITCDVDGYEATGDGTGALIEEPAAQLKHYLINFVFSQYKRGLWETSSDQVDATSFTAASAFFTARRYASARRISKVTKPSDLLAEWAQCHEARLLWGFPGAGTSGKVKLGIEDPTITDITSQEWQAAYIVDGELLSVDDNDRLDSDGLTVESVYDETEGKYLQTFSVTELSRPNPTEDVYSLRWGPAS